jgi:hypothetical protein
MRGMTSATVVTTAMKKIERQVNSIVLNLGVRRLQDGLETEQMIRRQHRVSKQLLKLLHRGKHGK